mmetsp:Transcript_42874/g.110574  ORF Transcript_42874/g.110574 Transcript_42874/m.110574 type:complete len:83 (-) Transcript_42874:7091-7339(-)
MSDDDCLHTYSCYPDVWNLFVEQDPFLAEANIEYVTEAFGTDMQDEFQRALMRVATRIPTTSQVDYGITTERENQQKQMGVF